MAASSLGLNVLLDEGLAGSLLLHPSIGLSGHIALDYSADEGIKIPHDVAIHPLGIIGLVARGSSVAGVASHGAGEGPVEVNEGHFDRLVQIKDYIIWLEVSVHETQVVQLLQPSSHLKQYLIKLPGVAVLLKVRPEIHVVPLDVHHNCITGEESALEPSDMLTIPPHCLVQDQYFVVELLGQHVVQLEVSIAVEAKGPVHTELCRYGLVQALLPSRLLDTCDQELVQAWAMSRVSSDNIEDLIIDLNIGPLGPLVDHHLKACLQAIRLLPLERCSQHLIWVDSVHLKILCVVLLNNMIF